MVQPGTTPNPNEETREQLPGPRLITIEEYRARQPSNIARKKRAEERDNRLTEITKHAIPKRRGGRKVKLLRLRRTLIDQNNATSSEEVRLHNRGCIGEIETELRRAKK